MKTTKLLLREHIRKILLVEKIVDFDGQSYDIAPDEIKALHKKFRHGLDYVDVFDDEGNVIDQDTASDRTYDLPAIVNKLLEKIPENKQDKLSSVLEVYEGTLQNDLVKTIYNEEDEVLKDLFSESPSPGEHSFPSAAWSQLVNIHRPGRSKAIGMGEAALALFLQGVEPDSGSGEHDLVISGIGGVHVKEHSKTLDNPDVPMGKGLNSDDLSRPSLKSAYKFFHKRGFGVTSAKENATEILDEFAKLTGKTSPLDYEQLANEWEDDFNDAFITGESWGGAGAVIFVDKGGLGFSIVTPQDAIPVRIENNKWRVGKASAYPGGRFASAFKAGVSVNESTYDAIRLLVREALLTEELTKSDKKTIEKIAKQHAKAHFDSEITKVLDKELGKSFFGNKGKINKFVDDSVSSRFKNADKDKDFDSAVIKVSRRVLRALYDMHYKRANLIDNMPIPK